MTQRLPAGIYIHIPFCRERCAYCDFAILTRQYKRSATYADAIVSEMRAFSSRYGRLDADTLYFGGGTPSSVPSSELAQLISAARQAFRLAPTAEISIEANPEDVSERTARAWSALGVNRITLGVQSLDKKGLERLGRPSTVEDALEALQRLRSADFINLGADMIFGAPGQSLENWQREIERVMDLGLDHLSCYALEMTGRTPLVRAVERGDLPPTDHDLLADMYELTRARLMGDGWEHYEISNFARPGKRSKHNLKYWSDFSYAGFGLSAASYVEGERWTAPRGFADYLRWAQGGCNLAEKEAYDPWLRAGEAIAFGMRRTEGVDLRRVAGTHGHDAVNGRREILDQAVSRGLADRQGSRIRLSERGLLLADEIFIDLL